MATGATGDSPSSPSCALPQVGERITFTLNAQTLEGRVGFAGEAEFAPGNWVGVILDGPYGKNNGSVKDKQYFSCKPQHGLFVRPQNILQVDSRRKSLGSRGFSTPRRSRIERRSIQEVTPSASETLKEELASSQEKRLAELTAELESTKEVSTNALHQIQSLAESLQSHQALEASSQKEQTEERRSEARLFQELQQSEAAASEMRKQSDSLSAALRQAEDDLKAKTEELRSTAEQMSRQELAAEKPLAELSCLRHELQVEQKLHQSKSEEIDRLERVLQQERQMCASLQRDWKTAQNVAEEARAELLRATRAQVEQAKELETISASASQTQSDLTRQVQALCTTSTTSRRSCGPPRSGSTRGMQALVLEEPPGLGGECELRKGGEVDPAVSRLRERYLALGDLRLELSQERCHREAKDTELQGAKRHHNSWADFFMSQMCCSRQGGLLAEDVRLDRLENPGSGEAPMR